jgi:hypothetical protein
MDILADVFAEPLTPLMWELYAFLWRRKLLEVVFPDASSRRLSSR